MIQYKNRIHQIVKRWPGDITGEEKVLTDDGTIWKTTNNLPEKGTGDRQGILFIDKVIE